MNRRSFLGLLTGGLAASAAVRSFPFRVFSFPKEIKPVYDLIGSPECIALELEKLRASIPAYLQQDDTFLKRLSIPRWPPFQFAPEWTPMAELAAMRKIPSIWQRERFDADCHKDGLIHFDVESAIRNRIFAPISMFRT
jgi:hypothetical protein